MHITASAALQIIFLSGMLLAIPGPTNTLLFIAGATSGFGRASRLIIAEVIGYSLAVSAWGMSMALLAGHLPGVVSTVKVIGAVYIFWLSLRIWAFKHRPVSENVVTVRNVVVTTLFNPKSFILATYIFPQMAFSELAVYWRAMLIFLLTLLPISIAWCLSGHYALKRRRESGAAQPVIFFHLASLALGAFSFLILYGEFSAW